MARRRGDRRGDTADRRPHPRQGARLVARWPADRVRLEPPPRPGPHRRAQRHPRRRCRDARGDRHHPRPAFDVCRPDMAPRRQDDRLARPSDGRAGGDPERHLAVPRRRPRRDADRRSEPVRAPRPDAALRDGQRRHPRRVDRRRPVEGWPLAPFQRSHRRCVRAVADRRGRRPRRAPDPRRALRLGLGRRPARGRWRRADRLPAFDRDRDARPVGPRRRRHRQGLEGVEGAEGPAPLVAQRRRPRRDRPARPRSNAT